MDKPYPWNPWVPGSVVADDRGARGDRADGARPHPLGFVPRRQTRCVVLLFSIITIITIISISSSSSSNSSSSCSSWLLCLFGGRPDACIAVSLVFKMWLLLPYLLNKKYGCGSRSLLMPLVLNNHRPPNWRVSGRPQVDLVTGPEGKDANHTKSGRIRNRYIYIYICIQYIISYRTIYDTIYYTMSILSVEAKSGRGPQHRGRPARAVRPGDLADGAVLRGEVLQ